MSDQEYPPTQLAARLSTISGKKRSWGEVAFVLIDAERNGAWTEQYQTLSDWISSVAAHLGLAESNMWRYLSAGRYALHLYGLRLGDRPDEEIIELLNMTSPENLELLSKLERVAPADVFWELRHNVLEGSISRAKLREVWQAFRPALQGRTAQGIGKAVPRVDLADPQQRDAVFRGEALTALSEAGPSCLGHTKPYAFAWLKDVRVTLPGGKRLALDATGVIQEHEEFSLSLHGVVIAPGGRVPESTEALTRYCDFLWVVSPNDQLADVRPPAIGLLELKNNQVVCTRTAEFLRPAVELSAALARATLLRAIQR